MRPLRPSFSICRFVGLEAVERFRLSSLTSWSMKASKSVLPISFRMPLIVANVSFFVMDNTTFLNVFCSLYIYYCITVSFFCQEFFLIFFNSETYYFQHPKPFFVLLTFLLYHTQKGLSRGFFIFFRYSFNLLSWSRTPRKFLSCISP